jgi:hypothetical protein
MVFTPSGRRNGAENAEFPVFSLVIREVLGGDWFAADCVIRHPVPQFSDVSENRSKFGRVRAISDQRMDPESGSGAAKWGDTADLSAVDLARSTNIRSNFALTEPFILPSS